jgi:prepilin-type N-terminal cleavage/methylation domain-containing protein
LVTAPLPKPSQIKGTKGVTLLELTVVLAILLIASGGIAMGLRQADARALRNASLRLQADLRYAQRRAIVEGRPFGVAFDRANNSYRIVSARPDRTIRTVALHGGVYIEDTSEDRLVFLPRGTPSVGFRVILAKGTYTQRITATVSGGRIRVFDINELDYE